MDIDIDMDSLLLSILPNISSISISILINSVVRLDQKTAYYATQTATNGYIARLKLWGNLLYSVLINRGSLSY